jgi:3-hydroxypropanoate dehydrogenase
MTLKVDQSALDILFREARTRNGWKDEPLPESLIHELYDLLKLGPTSANCSPARFVWVTSREGRDKLAGLAAEANAPKILEAPCTIIIGYDLEFAERMPYLFPHNPDAKDMFKDARAAEANAFRNSSLQGAYLMIAARALGLDCGPLSGFDVSGVNHEFFSGTTIKANFICCVGYGTDKNLFPRSPRLSFEEANNFA